MCFLFLYSYFSFFVSILGHGFSQQTGIKIHVIKLEMTIEFELEKLFKFMVR